MAESQGGRLYVTAPNEPEREFEIETAVVRIGREREPDNDLVIEHGWVSRSHARIYCDRLPYRIQDLRSRNGTSLNDVPLPPGEIVPLNDGDIIAIGMFRLRFEAPVVEVEAEEPQEPEDVLRGLSVRRLPTRAAPEPEEPPADVLEGLQLRGRRRPPTPPAELPPLGLALGERPPERFAGMPTRRSRLLQYLPTIYWENDFLGRFLLIPEDMVAPEQEIIDNFDLFLNPMTTPGSFLPWLNEWLGGIVDETWPLEIQRKVLREASWLYQHRGTYAGLERYLRLATECEPEIMENVDGAFSFRVILHTGGKQVDERMVQSVIEFNRPAHTVYTLEIDTSKPPEPPPEEERPPQPPEAAEEPPKEEAPEPSEEEEPPEAVEEEPREEPEEPAREEVPEPSEEVQPPEAVEEPPPDQAQVGDTPGDT